MAAISEFTRPIVGASVAIGSLSGKWTYGQNLTLMFRDGQQVTLMFNSGERVSGHGHHDYRDIIPADEASDYELLLVCYRSGQISPAQWQEHLKNEVFAAWLKRRQS